MTIAERVKNLKHSKSFVVKTNEERIDALKAFNHLFDAKVISFEIITRACKGGFKITRI